MTTLRWYITPELELLRRQASQSLGQPAKAQLGRVARSSAAPAEAQPWKPQASLSDRGDRYELQLQLPGVSVDSLEIEASRDRIRIRGQRPASTGQVIHSEFRTGPFERSLALTEEIQHQQVSARLEQGILSLTLPKLTAAQDYRVPVAIGTAVAQPETAAPPAPEAAPEVTPLALDSSVSEDVWAEQAA